MPSFAEQIDKALATPEGKKLSDADALTLADSAHYARSIDDLRPQEQALARRILNTQPPRKTRKPRQTRRRRT